MRTCAHACVYACVCTCVFVHLRVCVRACACVRTSERACVRACVCTSACVEECVRVRVSVRVRNYVSCMRTRARACVCACFCFEGSRKCASVWLFLNVIFSCFSQEVRSVENMYWLIISQLFRSTFNKTILRLDWWDLRLAAWKTCQRYTRILVWIIQMWCLFGVQRGTVQRILISKTVNAICRAFNAWWYTREWMVTYTYKYYSYSLSNIRVLQKRWFLSRVPFFESDAAQIRNEACKNGKML